MPQLSSLGGSNLTLVKKNPKDSLIFRVTEPYSNANIRVGTSVDISDSYMIVSGNGAVDYSGVRGHAYIYNLANGALIAHVNNSVTNDIGYGTSVSVTKVRGFSYGKVYCAIGAPAGYTAYGNTGQVFIYNASDGAYVRTYNCNSHVTNTAARDSRFGQSVSINGDYVYIGAPNHAVTNSSITYANNGTVQIAGVTSTGCNIINSPVYQDNLFWGYSVALSLELSLSNSSGGRLVIGAPGYNGNIGLVQIFNTYFSGTYQDLSNTILYGVTAGDEFGSTVAACNTYIAVAARGANSGAGRVYIYYTANNAQVLDISMNDINSLYGYSTSAGDSISSISINDEFIAIGVANEDSAANTNTGVVYLFDFVSSVTPITASWTAVSAGTNTTLALTSYNSLFAWGSNLRGNLGDGTTVNKSLPTLVGTPRSWTAISAGSLHTAAIRSDGALFTWGAGNSGQLGDGTTVDRASPVQVGLTTSWIAVSAGGDHTAAIRSDGLLFTWGNGANGKLGDGTTLTRTSPVQIGSSIWTTVSAGQFHTAAITSVGALFTWGSGTYGRLGHNNTTSLSSPSQVGGVGASSWTAVSAGGSHTAAIRSDYKLFTWGRNTYNQLGDGTTVNKSSPIQIGTSNWTKVSAGDRHNAATTSDYKLFTWGYNGNGRLGQDNTTYSWTSISSGAFHSAAIRSDGALFTWGSNAGQRLGINSTVAVKVSPVQVGASSWAAVSAGNYHTLAIRSDYKLFAWGFNSSGQLGDSTTLTRSSPVQIGTSDWTKVSAGGRHSLAIGSDNNMYAWGSGSYGQLGNGTTVGRSAPVIAGSGPVWTSVSAGQHHSAAITSIGSMYLFGKNDVGQLGDGTTGNKLYFTQLSGSNSWTMVSCGESHTAAITTGGLLFTWGYNGWANLGDGTFANKSSPVQINASIGNSIWSAVSAGRQHTIAIYSNGLLYAWGRNNVGQLGDGYAVTRSFPFPVGSSSWTAVSAGTYSNEAINLNNTLFTWGQDSYAQLGLGTLGVHKSDPTLVGNILYSQWEPAQVGTSSWTAVAAGGSHTSAIKPDYSLFSWGRNSSGQIGDSTIINKSSPVAVTNTLILSPLSFISGTTPLKSYKFSSTDMGNFGYSTALSGSKLIVGAPNINYNNIANSGTASVYNVKYPYLNVTTIPSYIKTDPNSYSTETSDKFGNTVYCSKDSDYTAILAVGEDSAFGTEGGVVYVYGSTNGALVSTLTIPYPNIANSSWRTYSVSISGSKVVISNPFNANTNVIITDITGATSNVYIQAVVASTTFGVSSDISGNNVVIGASSVDGANTDCGAAYIYASNGQLQYTLTPPNPITTGSFGGTVRTSNTYTLVTQPNGEYTNSSNGKTVRGRVYVYNTTTGSLLYTLENPGTDTSSTADLFGSRIAIYGNIGVVGASNEAIGGIGPAGYVYIFDLSTGTMLSSIQNPNVETATVQDQFGSSVDLYDGVLVVGAPYEDYGQTDSGIIYIFDIINPSNPRLIDTIHLYDDIEIAALYGSSVSISSNTIVVGAPSKNVTGTDAGMAFMYSYSKSKY